MKYRKKPVEIEALQLTKYNVQEIYKFIYGENSLNLKTHIDKEMWERYESDILESGFKIKTLEGEMLASFGDFIIKGIKGEFYPCKPDIFEATYELIE